MFLNTILDIIFPRYCLSCNIAGTDLCTRCLASFPNPERETENWIFPLFDYRHPLVKKTIKLIKYKGKIKLIDTLAEILYGAILEELTELQVMENFQEPVLIPIPLSKKRYRERGFNQAELLCKQIIKNDENKYLTLFSNVLVKIKETEHQANIKDRIIRLKNLKDSFVVTNGNLIKGRNIILIDDVTTTGATLNEARKILKKSGAKKIIAFTIAH
ncbi:hypothetical protein COU49_01985 [Candidatus Nomurabacteria bacterium CG10_big_fil_rev_8_21_14_0_10_35_16]|uniref:Phosphoribosyltransferase domain-containing protein n=1 Tax=Candidatus Nomurabacteria bacterium CG10_big_fil_rev_8_21_14_0_10_35_16 TaxID=1974731 RepID=A0A2H0TBC7_9BACT|nr:MAG: hypothetical protein COU49_01985 [Candidatus Nomurabacteria bacterium CG10_big_fil_rev_8_21_14_0_10_35_16]